MLAISISMTRNISTAIKQRGCDSSRVVQKDGQRYVVWSKFPGLLDFSFGTADRVREHLYRVHKNPPKCDKCQKVFQKQDQSKAHLRDQNNTDCKWMPEVPSKGISPEVVTELRKRKKSAATDEEKWFDIWHLLFPNEKIPDSACKLYFPNPLFVHILMLYRFWSA